MNLESKIMDFTLELYKLILSKYTFPPKCHLYSGYATEKKRWGGRREERISYKIIQLPDNMVIELLHFCRLNLIAIISKAVIEVSIYIILTPQTYLGKFNYTFFLLNGFQY